MRRMRVCGFAFVAFLLGQSLPSPVDAQWAVYEDWRSDYAIRADRWIGREAGALEIERAVKGDKLLLRLRREGTTVSNLGTAPVTSANTRVSFTDASSIDRVEADITVRALMVSDCPEATPVRPVSNMGAGVQLVKNGGSGGPGNFVGDLIATIIASRSTVVDGVVPDPEGVLRLRGTIIRCTNASCSTSTLLTLVDFSETVLVGDQFTLRLVWDRDNHRVLAGLGASPDVPLSYPPTATLTPGGVPSGIFLNGFAANNCTAGAADIELSVKEVRTNPAGIVP